MRPRSVVELDLLADRRAGLRRALVRVQIDFLVFQRAQEALDEDVVAPAAFAVHAQRNAVLLAERVSRNRHP